MGKCADCGYLAVRNRHDYSLNEADPDFREKGIAATVYTEDGRNPHRLHRDIPLCFAMCQYLGDAFKSLNDPSNPSKQVTSVIQTDNDCKEFIKWRQGFTPKEHREMMDRKTMLEMGEKRKQNDRKWHWIELAILVVGAGLFTLLGAWIT